MKLKKLFIIFIFISMFISLTYTYAQSNIVLETESEINVGEEFNLNIIVQGDNIYALTINLLYDTSKVEFIGDNGAVEVYENKLIYTWFDQTGGSKPKNNENIVSLKFKAVGSGEVNFGLNGEIYNLNGEISDVNYIGTSINIREIKNVENQNFQLESSNSVLLKEMRINYEGITPEFNKEIENYYFITDEDIDNIQVEAIPENTEAKVKITGSENIKYGLNKIQIEVSLNNNNKIYTINVTKTNNIELANSDLENLAIDSYFLNPEFSPSITNYNLEVSNDADKLNILAVPQNISASVNIIGNENLKEGNNIIKIIVNAQDKITKKEYILNVYKRNIREDMEYVNEKEIQIERLSELLEENVENQSANNEINENKNNDDYLANNDKRNLLIIIFAIIILLIVVVIVKVEKK